MKKISYLIYIILFGLIATTLSSCYTTYNQREELYNNPSKEFINNISYIILNNGNYMNAEDYNIQFYKEYKNNENVYIFNKKKSSEYIFFPSDSIKEVYIKIDKFDTGKTVVVSIASLVSAGILVLIGLLIALSKNGFG